jgi:hypothetical protein
LSAARLTCVAPMGMSWDAKTELLRSQPTIDH